jgi:uncharacterized protein YjdB
MPGEVVTWSVMGGGGAVSAPSSTTDADGRASVTWTLGATPGTNALRASYPSLPSVDFTAEAQVGPPATLEVTPAAAELEPGDTLRLTGSALDAFGNVVAAPAIDWTSAAPARATVSSSGLVTAREAGEVAVRATVGSVEAQSTIIVAASPPPPPTEPATVSATGGTGQSGIVGAALSERLEVRLLDAGGAAVPGYEVEWRAEGASGTLSPNRSLSDAEGRAWVTWTLGEDAGPQTVRAEVPGLPAVVFEAVAAPGPAASLAVAPEALTLTEGESGQLNLSAADAFGNPVAPPAPVWSSVSSAVATVSSNGVVSAVASGATTVRAEASGLAATASITVVDRPVTPAALTTTAGTGQTGTVAEALGTPLEVRLVDTEGAPIPGRDVAWTVVGGAGGVSAGSTTTDGDGRTAVSWTLGTETGTQRVRATFPGLPPVDFTATATAGPLASIALTPASATLEPGQSVTLSASGADAFGNAVPSLSLAWSSDAPAVATVSGSGQVTAVSDGSATIEAEMDGVRGTAEVTVTSPPPPPPPPPSGRTVFFTEDFENDAFGSRGWYDNLSVTTTGAEAFGGSRSLEARFNAGSATPTWGGTIRRDLPETESLYLSYRVKYSANWVGSGVGYHPHDFYFLTNRDGRWIGPSTSHLTTYVETVYEGGGIRPVVGLRDNLNINTANIGVDLTGVTEDRAVAGCNGNTDGYATGCWSNGGGNWANEKFFQSSAAIGRDAWHHVEVYFEMNSIVGGIGQPDGVIRYWLDGALVLERTGVLFRTGANASMRYDQILFGPFIGVGSPVTQTMWIDDLEVADRR